MCVSHTYTHDPPPEGDSPVSIAQGIQSVFGGHMAWRDVGDHAGFGIANERVLQNLFETEGRSMKSTNQGPTDYLLCAGHWATGTLTPFYEKVIHKRRNTVNKQKVPTSPLIKEMQTNHFKKLKCLHL